MNIVLLHAFPLDPRMWEPQRAPLSAYEVVAPNLYELGSTMDEWAESVLRAVDGELVAVGASMGGYCALGMARRAPERLRGLVLVGARADADSPERRAGRAETIALIRSAGAQGLWADMRPKLFPEHADEAVVLRARAIALGQDTERLIVGVGAIRDRVDSTDLVSGLSCPVLVAVGEHDPFFPPGEARELAALAPNGRFVAFEGAGHLPSLDRPEQFNSQLTRFVSHVDVA